MPKQCQVNLQASPTTVGVPAAAVQEVCRRRQTGYKVLSSTVNSDVAH